MNHFLSLTVAAIILGLALAQDDPHDEHTPSKKVGNGYYNRPYGGHRYGGRHGYGGYRGGHGGGYGYGYSYKKCPDLEDPENGDVKVFGLYPGNRAVHYCTKGFILVGSKVRVCQKDGTWSKEPPTCEPVDCGEPDAADPNGSRVVGGTIFKSTTTYSCNEGYIIDVTQGGSDVIICQATAEWSDTAAVCIPVDCCQPPEESVHGELDVGETILGSMATYTCNIGYSLSTGGDSLKTTCQTNAEWDITEAPGCDPVDCGNPPAADANGQVAFASTTYQSTAIYSCNNGYVFDSSSGGAQQVECLYTGLWSDTAGGCTRIDCGFIAYPTNGAVNYNVDTQLGSTAEFSCDYGYNLNGSASRVCEANGDWSLSSPTCYRISCPKLEAPDYGKVVVSGNYVDDTASYSCSYGFSLKGNKVRTCQLDGAWSGSDPSCVKDPKYHGYGYGGRRGYGGHHGDYHGDDGY